MRLCILESAYKQVTADHYIQMMAIQNYFINKKQDIAFAIVNMLGIDNARNWLTKEFLKASDKFDYALYLDSDHIFNAKNIEDIVNNLESNNFDILSGKYYQRNKMPLEICAYTKIGERDYLSLKDDNITEKFEPVDAVGFGFILVRKEVLIKLSKNYQNIFEESYDEFRIGEDVNFCRRAQKLGYKIFLDTENHIKHEGFII